MLFIRLSSVKHFFEEFKEFAVKGNVIDLAVGIIIGGAFGQIVTSLVNDIVMPPVGAILGGFNFKDLKIILKPATEISPEVTMNIGNFLQIILNFLIVSFAIFFMIKAINKLKRKEEVKEVEAKKVEVQKDSKEVQLLEQIRDLLKESTKYESRSTN